MRWWELTNHKLFLLPIEPLAERYTGWWYDYLPRQFAKHYAMVEVAGSALTTTVETGAFLDLFSTVAYKASQLQRMAVHFRNGDVKDGDVIFIADLEFWGVEALRYMARLSGIHVRIAGFLHAASYTKGDFMEPMADIGQWAELAWLATCDAVFVGSEYHKKAVIERRLESQHGACLLGQHIHVVGNFWDTCEAQALARTSSRWRDGFKDFDVCFPHRPDSEKRPLLFLKVLDAYERLFGHRPFVVFTTGRQEYRSTNCPEAVVAIKALEAEGNVTVLTGLGRADFYAVLARSRVVMSTAAEENFGYAIVEGMAQGALPLVPFVASYPELVRNDPSFLYKPMGTIGLDVVARKLHTLMGDEGAASDQARCAHLVTHWDASFDRVMAVMQEWG